MKIINDYLRGVVKIQNLPERAEFGSWLDVLQSLEKYLVIQLPQGVSGVVYSQEEPSDDLRGKIWIRLNGTAGIVGVYYYAKGAWKPMHNPPKGEIYWIYGDSSEPPDGFKAILEGDSYIDSATVTQLKNRYIQSADSSNYIYYAARFTGY